MKILGFTQSTSGVSVVPQLPMNLLGIQKINICSGNLSTLSSFSSSPALSNSVIQSIPVDVPSISSDHIFRQSKPLWKNEK
jgi:hypothetical protein